MKKTSRTQDPGEARDRMRGVVDLSNPPRRLKKVYTFKSGLQAGLGCCWREKDDLAQGTVVDEYLYFCFQLEGEKVETTDGLYRDRFFCSGSATCVYTPGRESSVRYPQKTLTHNLFVGMNRNFIDNRLGGADHPGFPKDLLAALEQGATGCCHKPFTITPWMRSLIHQVGHNPYQSRLAELYAEARVLDLIVIGVEALGGTKNAAGSMRFSPQDVERVRHAADILVLHMENPPSLVALAKQVGLNENKLKQGFRQVFDTTAFGFLRRQRMLRARDMLSGGDVTVCQAACSVGYANPSHFSRAFFDAFGVKPGAYLGEAKDRAMAVLRR